jgi:hypothetical protein
MGCNSNIEVEEAIIDSPLIHHSWRGITQSSSLTAQGFLVTYTVIYELEFNTSTDVSLKKDSFSTLSNGVGQIGVHNLKYKVVNNVVHILYGSEYVHKGVIEDNIMYLYIDPSGNNPIELKKV